MMFRYFDVQGQPLSREELAAMDIVTPVMEHVFADILHKQRHAVEKPSSPASVARGTSDVV